MDSTRHRGGHAPAGAAYPESVATPSPSGPHPDRARIRALSIVLVAGAFGVVLAGIGSTVHELERHLAPKELALHAAALASLALLIPRWRRIELGVLDAILAAFLAWTAISAALATNAWFAVRGFGVTFSAFVIYLAARDVQRHGAAQGTLAGIVLAAILGGLLGVAQAYGADWRWLAESRPPGGTFGNRNFLAHLMAIVTPALLLFSARGRLGTALIGYVGLTIAAAAIVLTRSRAAWLGVTGALAILTLGLLLGRRVMLVRGARLRLLGAIVLVGAGAVAALSLPNRLQWRSESPYAETLGRIAEYREGSGRGRLIQYGNSFELVRDAPVFGVGPGNWFVHYPRVTTRGDPSFASADPIPTNPWPSSDWVALLIERGAVAVLLALLAGGTVAAMAARRAIAAQGEAAFAGVALLGVVSATAITGAFDAVLMLPPPAYLVAALAGLLLPGARIVVTRTLGRWPRRIGATAALVIATSLVLSSAGHVAAVWIAARDSTRSGLERAVRFYPGDHRLRLLLARRGPCSARLPHARAAASLMPHHEAPRRALANCGVRLRRNPRERR